tara:strand:+ start:652 stop:1968 length:1317 start_codon:yes stop_codon:yes gene_type:complete
MQLVLLAGELGEKYGQKHEYYNLQTPADAIKLLCINYPALKNELVQAHQNGVGYKVIQGGAAMNYDELQLPFGSKPLLVVPVITGSGGGATTQILLGVGLVAASFLLPGAGLFGTFGAFGAGAAGVAGISTSAVLTATTIGTALSAVGASMILGGVANLISPQPELPKPNRIRGSGTNVRGPGPDGITRGASGNQSYAFTGPANTAGTGTTLPVIYGRVIAGSHLLAANLDVTDNSDPLQTATQSPGVRTLKINGESLTRDLKDCGGVKSRRGVRDFKSSDTNRDERVFIGKTFGPGESQPLEAEAQYDSNSGSGGWSALKFKNSSGNRKRIDVIFKISKGLDDFVAGNGSTRIDGFITYQITLSNTTGGPDIDVASARITVQGLTSANQDVIFGNRLEAPRIEKRSGEDLDIKVEIIEVSVRQRTTFELLAYGYDLL